MALTDFESRHYTDPEKATVLASLATIQATLGGKSRNLTPDESSQYGSIDEKNKGIVNKALDYHNTVPALDCPDVNWVEYVDDGKDRSFLDQIMSLALGLHDLAKDGKIARDYDNFGNARTDYDYAKFKANTGGGSLWEQKVADYAVFFT